jgi:hypothetical protein
MNSGEKSRPFSTSSVIAGISFEGKDSDFKVLTYRLRKQGYIVFCGDGLKTAFQLVPGIF